MLLTRENKMRVTFVVKGESESRYINPAIHTQLSQRGINAKIIHCLKTETVFELLDAIQMGGLRAWFADNPEIISGYGYPDGTLLIFSTHEN
jgi:hypothetical protein